MPEPDEPLRACTAAELGEAEQRLGLPLPPRVRAIYEVADGRYRSDGEWWVVWPLWRVVKSNLDGWTRGLSRSLLAFGDDGTGDSFCAPLDHDNDEVVRWNWIDLDIEESEGTTATFLARWADQD